MSLTPAASPPGAGPAAHPAPGVRRPAGPGALHRARSQGRRHDRADAGRRPARRPGARRGRAAVEPGVTTDELDRIGHDFLVDHGAYPSTLGYRGFPKSLCTSVNEVICHGIPDSTVLRDGDIVNIDITAFIGGVHGDTDATFLVGDVDEEARLLVERTDEALRGHQGGRARPADQRDRPGDRVVRPAVRLRRRPRLHRPRHRHRVPLRAGRPALRRPAVTTRDRGRA